MKNLNRLLPLSLGLMMTFSIFTGCGKLNDPGAGTAASTAPAGLTSGLQGKEDPFKEPMVLSIAHWEIEKAVNTDVVDPIREELYKKFNITIKPVEITWDDYQQKINVWVASSQLPDLFSIDAITSSNYEKWVTQGVVHELPTDLSQYPHLKKYLNQKDVQSYKYPMGKPEAKYYCIPRPTYSNVDMWANDVAVFLRKDWMERVGITKVPENMAEFITLMQAFTTKDPDGNGKKDTVGLTLYNAGWLYSMLLGYEPAINGQWIKDRDGKWMPGFMTENAIKGAVALKKLYDAGGLDKDFATLKGEEGMDKFISGVAGAYAHSGYPNTQKSMYDKLLKINPKAIWQDTVVQMHPFKADDGNYYRQILSTPWSESYINGSVNEKKVDRILRLYDYGFSEEGFNLLRYGIEGIDYKKEGQQFIITREKDKTGNYVNLFEKYPITGIASLFSWAQDFAYKNTSISPDILKMANDTLRWEIDQAKPTPTNLSLGFLKYPAKEKEVFNLGDELTKAIFSNDAEKEWRQMIKDYRLNGYDQAISELNAAAKQAGLN